MASPNALKILVLAHNLADAAIARRVSMLKEGGALVTVAGFRRTAEPPATVSGCRAIDFGQTFDYGFVQRIKSVLREVFLLKRRRELFAEADVILARNLEMLAIGVRGRSLCRPKPALVYESLDIHRLLLGEGLASFCLRWLEGWLSRRASALFTSSPAFVNHYFATRSFVKLPVRLLENKMSAAWASHPKTREPGMPWVIGWFGIIRCHKSLAILSDLVRQSAGQIEVVIRGRPDLVQFENFEKSTTEIPGLKYLGPYRSPDELAHMYETVHFTWAIDMFEEGLNSSWLLPNRLYEGGAFGSVPIAIEDVETGRFLQRLGLGVRITDPLRNVLAVFFKDLTADKYRKMEHAVVDVPRSTWLYDRDDCKQLVDYMRSLTGAAA